MALDHNRLTKISGLNPMADHAVAPDPSLWYYVSADTLATVLAANYFSTLAGKLEVDDRILCELGDGDHKIKVSAMSKPPAANSVTVVAVSGTNSERGQATTVTASDTIVTGMALLHGVVVTSDDSPILAAEWVTASIGDQAGAPAAGSFLLKSWKPTGSGDVTPIAATTFGKKVNWLAW